MAWAGAGVAWKFASSVVRMMIPGTTFLSPSLISSPRSNQQETLTNLDILMHSSKEKEQKKSIDIDNQIFKNLLNYDSLTIHHQTYKEDPWKHF